ncbi:hypothetical protein PI125_g12410 [Phytophthora idaei]|nr:hypothetical protein PI125_g12410 [Phytophthora idaei]
MSGGFASSQQARNGFGSAAVDPAITATVNRGILRALPLASVQTEAVSVLQSPWGVDDHAVVQIPAEDILSGAINRNTGEPVDPEAFDDLQIDLWLIYEGLELFSYFM